MKELKDGIRSIVKLDFYGQVHKTFRGTDREKRFEQEIAVLKTLEERGCDYVPRLLESHPEELRIVTTNCGAPAPHLSKKKATSLFDALERDFGIVHDDPEPRNITYSAKMGRFCIIDFELATILDQTGGKTEHSNIWCTSWNALSEKGKKHDSNDDAWLVMTVSNEETLKRDQLGEHLLDPAHILLVVSDGMGGRNAGELASRLIINWVKKNAETVFAALIENPDDLSPLETLLKNSHDGLNELAANDPQLEGMGTTTTMAWITPGRLHFAHIGDSRLYLHRDGETQQLTKDHCFAWTEWQRLKTPEITYRQHPRRAALYQSLGGAHRNIHPQLESCELKSGDRLLLCSDGIVDGLWQQNIHQGLDQGNTAESAESLMARALKNDGSDDTTLIVADIRTV